MKTAALSAFSIVAHAKQVIRTDFLHHNNMNHIYEKQ